MEDAKARFELIRADDDWTDERMLEATLGFAHQKLGEELDLIRTHGYHSADPETAAEQDEWFEALWRYLPKLERLMTTRGMTFTSYKPFQERQTDVF